MLKKMCVMATAVALLGCGGSGGASSATGPSTPAPGNTPVPTGSGGISVTNDAYSPSDKTIAVGTTVQWSWNACDNDPYGTSTCVSHSVTFDDGATSPTQDKGTYTRTFTAAGVYNYHCAIHGAAMTGKITVQ